MATTTRRPGRPAEFFATYTRDLTREGMERLFTRDARDAYRLYTRGLDHHALSSLRWHQRLPAIFRHFFLAFSEKLSPPRRAVYGVSLVIALIGLIESFRGFAVTWVPAAIFFDLPVLLPQWAAGSGLLLVGFVLLNLLVFLEVADRLTLKDDLEIAREIQQAMLPQSTCRVPQVEVHGQTRPANTVGGDFYDIQLLSDGRIVVAIGDVAGKGSPAALLMALLLAMLRTLLDEGLEPPELIDRLNLQIYRHAPRSRFITLFFAVIDPGSGALTYVNAGQNPPLLRRTDGRLERLTDSGIALGLAESSRYRAQLTTLLPGDVLVLYSDGITEAEDPEGVAFEETGLERAIAQRAEATAPDLGAAIVKAVEVHAKDTRFADDLTVVVLRRLPPLPSA
jgi:serine phosphatase RsbU (regulator of sigma subunit)